MITEQKPMNDVIEEALSTLTSNIGPANTARFINYFTVGFGNYTEERKKTFEGYTVNDIVSEIEDFKNPHTQ